MKRLTAVLWTLLIMALAGQTRAQVDPADIEKLFNFAEATYPDLVFPPGVTQNIDELGSNWYFRDYGYLSPTPNSAGVVVAVNNTGGSGFTFDQYR